MADPVVCRGRVLLAEDSLFNQITVKAFLAPLELEIHCVENGRAAVELFVCNHYDLVLLDIQMPELDGYQTAEAMRRWEREQRLAPCPIVAVTAGVLEDVHERVLTAGCNELVVKPLQRDEFRELVEEYLVLSRAAAPPAPAAPPVSSDRAVLAELEHLRPLFFEHLTENLAAITAAARIGDWETVSRLAHGGKGNALLFGYGPLAAALAALEKGAKGGDAATVWALIAAVEAQRPV